jgi:outer membrane lipoprotein SlyB
MKNREFVLAFVAMSLALSGCETPEGTPDRTASGALIGGAIGAGSGAIIGGRNAGAGALIGGAIGAITGGLIGHSMDEEQRERLRAAAPETLVRVDQGQPLGVADIKAMAKAGVSDEVIISQIRNSHTVYHLSTSDIIDLKNSGVSEPVIDFMINTASGNPTASVAPPPPPPPDEKAVVVDQPPPPPVEDVVVESPGPDYVWIGGSWVWDGGRWVWVRGHWDHPPRRGVVWMGGRWERRGGGGVWISGHWH